MEVRVMAIGPEATASGPLADGKLLPDNYKRSVSQAARSQSGSKD
jgi:hypothetical protein